ncbi:hypothetical protein TNCV_1557361 [Trichonephila clavipes]|nr:hypothetical protein TNCV_1557361 [Trichonephila clavipes]
MHEAVAAKRRCCWENIDENDLQKIVVCGFLGKGRRSLTSVTLRWMTSLKRRLCKQISVVSPRERWMGAECEVAGRYDRHSGSNSLLHVFLDSGGKKK